MKLDDYIKSHINEIEKIPMKDIIITSRVHLKGKFERSNQPSEDLIIVVKKMKLQNKYALVVSIIIIKEVITCKSIELSKIHGL